MYGISEVISMKIGIMGGTFDPIHNGHLHLAQTALTQFDLDQIWFMPNGMPPHKKQSSIESDIHERIAMTQIAIKANKQFYLQEYEAKREKEHGILINLPRPKVFRLRILHQCIPLPYFLQKQSHHQQHTAQWK